MMKEVDDVNNATRDWKHFNITNISNNNTMETVGDNRVFQKIESLFI